MALKFTQLKSPILGLESTLDFGCHFGYTVLEVLKDRPEYIRWLIKEGKQFSPEVYMEVPEYTLVSKQYAERSEVWNVFSDQDDWFDDVPF